MTTAATATRLRQFQDGFAAALRDPDAPCSDDAALARLLAQPGFSVYRNTVIKGCVDALAANFPAVLRLVGDEWFRAAATIYARSHLPQQPTLLTYGADFADWLASFPPADELPYLADVARVDRLWSEAHTARDETPLAVDALAALAPTELGQARLRPHAAARWAWFASMPIATIWQRNREKSAALDAPLEWHGEGVLLVRPHGAIESQIIGAAACALLEHAAAGEPLAAAAEAALTAEPRADLAQVLAMLLGAGAFGPLRSADAAEADAPRAAHSPEVPR